MQTDVQPVVTRELIGSLPKSDLHVHLDGSLRAQTLIELAGDAGVLLPSNEEEGLNELVFKRHYADLTDYLKGFQYTVAVMRNPENIERIAFELAEDTIGEGVRYLETRFAPQLHVARGQEALQALAAAARGLERAARRHNRAAAVCSGDDLPFHYGIICCAMRNFAPTMSTYYADLAGVLPEMPHKNLVAVASLEAARLAIRARDELGLPVVGFDLAGEESGYRAAHHVAAYQQAQSHFMHKTVHAGEAYGPESIYEALTLCHADRIGHGTWLFAADRVGDARIDNAPEFVRSLVDYIGFAHITIEVCPTSNLQTMPEIADLSSHPLHMMLDHCLSVAIATDNRLVSHTSLTDEIWRVFEASSLDRAGLHRLVLGGFKGAFFPGSYADKRAFVARAAARIEQRLGLPSGAPFSASGV